MEVVDLSSDFSLDFQFAFWTGLESGILGLNLSTELGKSIGGEELWKGARVGELTKSLEVTSILMHGNLHNPVQDSEDFVLSLQSVFKFKVFVPERMSKEVQANRRSATLK